MFRSIGRIILFFVRGTVAALIICLLFYFLQDFQVFPAAFDHLIFRKRYLDAPVPDQIQRFIVDTPDGQRLETWRLDVPGPEPAKGTALIFHDGSSTVRDVLPYQLWLRDLNFRSYSFDYRGLGLSSGWPSELGMYQDAEALWRFIRDRDNPGVDSVALVGIGVGGGPAAWLGSLIEAKAIVLFSPFVSVESLLERWPFLPYLSPLLRYNLPVRDLMLSFKGKCAIVAAGMRDASIPFVQSQAVYQGIPIKIKRYHVTAEQAANADVFVQTRDKVAESLGDCFGAAP